MPGLISTGIVSNDSATGAELLRGKYFFSFVWDFIEEDILKRGFGD